MPPLKASTSRGLKNQYFDLIVVGGTPAGIACAVRAAREGVSVLLVQHNHHLGGMLTNGLMQWDALYAGFRAPFFNEVAEAISEHYLSTFGADSPQYAVARFSQEHYPVSRFEPKVAERILTQKIHTEKNVSLLLGHIPVRLKMRDLKIASIHFAPYGGGESFQIEGKICVDATYEGDLLAMAGVPYRVGREGRDEFGEPHAGKVFTNILKKKGPRDAVEGRLNLHPYSHVQGSIDPNSPFTSDDAIQAYNFRFCLTDDPAIRVPQPVPDNYNRDEFANYYRKAMGAGRINRKGSFNSPILPGEGKRYPEASWPEREHIIARHRDFALGLMHFLQTDASVDPELQAYYRTIGLPSDEFQDNGHLPYELYVREARRMLGRRVFTELDNMPAANYERTPIQMDSVAITDWSMDSHDCSYERRSGYDFDGKLILTEESRPAQIPWSSLISDAVENLIVPVCLSATHVAWGAVRLEPVWMQVGEAAGVAAASCILMGAAPVTLDTGRLQRTLIERKFCLTFFNDLDTFDPAPRVQAAQFFGTKGFFPRYDARLDDPVGQQTETLWRRGLTEILRGSLNPEVMAEELQKAELAETPDDTGVSRGELLQNLFKQIPCQ